MRTKHQEKTEDFFARRPVFTLDEAMEALTPAGSRTSMAERLAYHVAKGRLKRIARELYAVVPRGQSPERFHPDAYLVASALRPEGVFCYHSALELLGVAHSMWHQCTVFCARRRRPLDVGGTRIAFYKHPDPFVQHGAETWGTRNVERLGRLVRVTGPERTLVEGFRRLDRAGGPEEFVTSIRGVPSFDLALLESVLERYAMARLWGAVGWFLETHQRTFHVPDSMLERLERHRPRGPQYLAGNEPGGEFVRRWNLVLPRSIAQMGEPDNAG